MDEQLTTLTIKNNKELTFYFVFFLYSSLDVYIYILRVRVRASQKAHRGHDFDLA